MSVPRKYSSLPILPRFPSVSHIAVLQTPQSQLPSLNTHWWKANYYLKNQDLHKGLLSLAGVLGRSYYIRNTLTIELANWLGFSCSLVLYSLGILMARSLHSSSKVIPFPTVITVGPISPHWFYIWLRHPLLKDESLENPSEEFFALDFSTELVDDWPSSSHTGYWLWVVSSVMNAVMFIRLAFAK